MFDKAIGATSDALKFWAEFYKTLLGNNQVDFRIRWNGLQSLQLTAMEERFARAAPTLSVSPRFCHHSAPVESDLLSASPQNAVGWEFDFVRRAAGYLLGQFRFDPAEALTLEVLADYHAALTGPPAR
jgi:hypothetical protein